MRAASSSSCGIVFSAPYMTTIQPPAPVQNAIIAKMKGRFPGAIDWTKMLRPEHVVQQERAGADRRVEHEEPDQDGRRAGQRARDVEEEAEGRRDPVRAAVQEEREPDDEDDEQAEPDARVDEDVLERRDEAVVVVRPHEVVEAGPAAVDVGEGEIERVDHRRDAEHDQERQVRQDERQAAQAAGATLARGPRGLPRSGQTRSSRQAVIA